MATLSLAGFLGLQCLWLLAAEHYHLRCNNYQRLGLPLPPPLAATQRRFGWPPSVEFAGELWAESAFSYARTSSLTPQGKAETPAWAGKLASLGPTLQRSRGRGAHSVGRVASSRRTFSALPDSWLQRLRRVENVLLYQPYRAGIGSATMGMTTKLHWSSDDEMRQFVGWIYACVCWPKNG